MSMTTSQSSRSPPEHRCPQLLGMHVCTPSTVHSRWGRSCSSHWDTRTVHVCDEGQHPWGATPAPVLVLSSESVRAFHSKAKPKEIPPLPHPTTRSGAFPRVYFCSHPGGVLWQNPPARPNLQHAAAEPVESLRAGQAASPQSQGRQRRWGQTRSPNKSNVNIPHSHAEEGRVKTANTSNSLSAWRTSGTQ